MCEVMHEVLNAGEETGKCIYKDKKSHISLKLPFLYCTFFPFVVGKTKVEGKGGGLSTA